MDFKADIEKIIEKFKNDEALRERFKKEPVKTLEETFNIDLPEDKINEVVVAVKTKLDFEDVPDKAAGALGGIKDLFEGK